MIKHWLHCPFLIFHIRDESEFLGKAVIFSGSGGLCKGNHNHFIIYPMGQKWTPSEDEALRELIAVHGKHWCVIATKMPNRNPTQVAARWQKCLNPALTKGSFSLEEDQTIARFVQEHGIHAWPKISALLPNRSPKQCRERWFMNLDPGVTKEAWTFEEDNQIFQLHHQFGPKWALIAQGVPGRTDNAVKNRWNASISKRIGTQPDGEQYLMPSMARKYTRRKLAERHRPPALILPPVGCPLLERVMPMPDLGSLSLPTLSPMLGEGMIQDGFELGAFTFEDSFESPLGSPSWNLGSPNLMAHLYF
jgi:hypothetical protein